MKKLALLPMAFSITVLFLSVIGCAVNKPLIQGMTMQNRLIEGEGK